MRFLKFLIPLLLAFSIYADAEEAARRTLVIFHSPSCRKCIEAKEKLIPEIEKEFKGEIDIEYRDITDMENYKLMLGLKEKYSPDMRLDLPVFYFEGNFLGAQVIVGLRQLIAKAPGGLPAEGLPAVDLVSHFKSFRPLAIISAGLIDGINPCAFTVIVFFMSFLALQGYRKRELLVIGLTFIFSVFLTYILIGVGLFSLLYRLKGFKIAVNTLNFSVGIFSIALGAFALYDFFKFKKTGVAEGMVLQLPKAVKNRIHSVIGAHYRKSKKTIFKLAVSALVSGFTVSLLEAVCTGQLYLPTLVFVLKTTPLKLEALGYLLLYNFMFIVPLLGVFLFALLGVTSGQFSGFLKRHLLSLKLVMAVMFFGLGIYLIWRPDYPFLQNQAQDQAQDPFSFDFGKVKQGQTLKHNFTLRNEAQKILQIKEVNTSCGCTVSKIEKKTLKPGESALIEVALDTKGYSGPIQQFVYVHTDNLDNPILRFIIKANVIR